MQLSPILEKKWMYRALELAAKGIPGAGSNPLVGCVIVKNGKVVGEGAHLQYGGPHAEVQAIRQAGKHCLNAVLFTNLEPCCHWGKTPPCTDAIIRAKIGKVVTAVADPNPLVRRKGFERLIRAGIPVKNGICGREARDLNRSYFKFILKKKPYVFLKSAASLDGKTATATGDSHWISSRKSRRFSHRLRAGMDGILVGAETIRKDNPSLTSHGQGRNPVRIILSGTGLLPRGSQIFNGQAPTWVFYSSPNKSLRKKNKRAEWIYLKSQRGKIDLTRLLHFLAERGISRLLIEGGGETAAGALDAKQVDEIFFFMAPILIGGKNSKTILDGTGVRKVREAPKLNQMTVRFIDQDLVANARVSY